MTSLHERLADLAEDAPTGAPAADLWDRGCRAARRQRLGLGWPRGSGRW